MITVAPKKLVAAVSATLAIGFLTACNQTASVAETDYGISATSQIIVTNEAGDVQALRPNVSFDLSAKQAAAVITIDPAVRKQTIVGIGSSFTESSAFVLAHLEPDVRAEVMQNVYGAEGANFSLTRTPIGATDFSVEGQWSYADVEGDVTLKHFSIEEDKNGFSKAKYPNIKDETFDVLPMIQEALAIKANQDESDLRIISSAWSAPAWMKDIETFYIRPTPENGYEGTGGELKPEYVGTYVDYIVKYLDAYKAAGVDIWGLTPVNEPAGNSGQWESMHFTPETQRDFIKDHLGPTLKASAYKDINVLIYDQNRDHLEDWTDTILGDEETAQYVYGTAVHWYSSTYKVYEDALERVATKFPGYGIINTEATIDDLGKPAPNGVSDPENFQESGWFANDEFWWNATATDWAYSAEWAPNAEDHPIYTPVHRYARNIIVSLDHWMEGWVDWNIALDHNGGPNHVGNFCGAPIMIDTNTGEIYYTPVFHVLSQFSRTIRPGDVAVQTSIDRGDLGDDSLHTSATLSEDNVLTVQLLNTTKQSVDYVLEIGAQTAQITIDANAVQTVRVQL
ncbi:glycoside hydrolase family 30 protein [Neiella holothuriorum]|uniref:glycoside hydrolase family 30 protein n=1 Tax=Neiella holothuriorum TaxID=2870530 RepID=UPI00298F63FE|nr:glycoside hydrolase family 30 beta sandwich domain-containing protein [Neiella holothuriorum]